MLKIFWPFKVTPKSSKKKIIFIWYAAVAAVFVYFLYLAYVYYLKSVSFSFIDEFNNVMTAWFMLQHKQLYTEVFHNHQPFPAYFSYFIQLLLHPATIYKLITYHRFFVLAYVLAWNALIIRRFRRVGLVFAIVSFASLYWNFGYLFLGESLIAQPLVYLAGLALEHLHKKRVSTLEYLLAAGIAWYVVFMREPFIPAVLFLYATLFYRIKIEKKHIISASAFVVATGLVLIPLPLKEYVYSIWTLNRLTVIDQEVGDVGSPLIYLFKSVGYPLYVLTVPTLSFVYAELSAFSVAFVASAFVSLRRGKERLTTLWMWLVLASLAVRFVEPGATFYSSYRMLPWDSMLFFFISWISFEFIPKVRSTLLRVVYVTTYVVFLVYLLNPHSFIWERRDRVTEFNNNYAPYFTIGDTIKGLADPGDTMFVGDYSSLIYWQANIPVSYKYILYYPVVYNIHKYRDEKDAMFYKNPPTFFYDFKCDLGSDGLIPESVQPDYRAIMFQKNYTCLFVRKEKVDKFTDAQKAVLAKYEYWIKQP